MFAIIKTGGKQYRVSENDVLKIEKVDGEAGSTITFDTILMLGGDTLTVGTPTVEGATVEAELVDQMRDKKVLVFKKKRRQNYRRMKGHRQHLSVVKIKKINAK
jgi:large subunit ribosomal protein L21